MNIRNGEGLPVAMLLLWSLFQGVFIAFYLTAANTAFLDDWGFMNLPWAFIASGIAGYFSLRQYARMEVKLNFQNLMICSHAINLILVLFFSLGFKFTNSPWFSFFTFIWIGPALSMTALGFWGLAGRLFNLQQGKRLFGLISSGEVASNIGAFLVIPFLPSYAHSAARILAFSTVGLGFSMVMVPILFKTLSSYLQEQDQENEPPQKADEASVKTQPERLDPYFLLISAIVFFAVCNQQLLDFTLLAQFNQYESGQNLASFLAVYFGAMSFAELMVKTLISGRLLRAYGIVAGLYSLPVVVFLCIAFIAFKTDTTTPFFFVMILVTKILEHVLRFAVFDPSFKVLFQPLPPRDRFAVQTRAEGVVRQASVIITGIGLLLITRQPEFEISMISKTMSVIILLWLGTTFMTYKQYRKKLMERLSHSSLKSVLPTPVEQLAQAMNGMSEFELGYALNVIEKVEPGLLNIFLPKLLLVVSPNFRKNLLARIRRLRQVEISGVLEDMLDNPKYEEAREDLQQTWDVLNQIKSHQLPLSKLKNLAASKKPEDRAFAALLLSRPKNADSVELLRKMLWDPDPTVRQTAILSAGISRNPLYWPCLIEMLSSGMYCNFAATALTASGEAVTQADFSFYRFQNQPEIQIRILKVHERVGGEAAQNFLLDKIIYPQRDVRHQALFSLGYLGYQASNEYFGMIKSSIIAKVKYIAWNTAARLDLRNEGLMAPTYNALKKEILAGFEMLYLLLTLICDKKAIRLIKDNVTQSEGSRAFALEIAEHATPAELKPYLFPLFECLPPPQRLARLQLYCPQETYNPKERLEELLIQGPSYINSWTKACAIDALFRIGGHHVPDALISNLQHPNRMIREISARTIRRLDIELFKTLQKRLPIRIQSELKNLGVEMESQTGMPAKKLLIFDKIKRLKEISVFKPIPEKVLVRFAERVEEVRIKPKEPLFNQGEPGDSMYFIITGSIAVQTPEGKVVAQIGKGEMLGEIAALDTNIRTLSAVSEDYTHMFEISRNLAMDMMTDHLEIIPGIIKTTLRRRSHDSFN